MPIKPKGASCELLSSLNSCCANRYVTQPSHQPIASRRPMKRVKRSESKFLFDFSLLQQFCSDRGFHFHVGRFVRRFGCFFAPKTECFPINTASSDAFANLFDCCIQKGLSQIGVVDDAR